MGTGRGDGTLVLQGCGHKGQLGAEHPQPSAELALGLLNLHVGRKRRERRGGWQGSGFYPGLCSSGLCGCSEPGWCAKCRSHPDMSLPRGFAACVMGPSEGTATPELGAGRPGAILSSCRPSLESFPSPAIRLRSTRLQTMCRDGSK